MILCNDNQINDTNLTQVIKITYILVIHLKLWEHLFFWWYG